MKLPSKSDLPKRMVETDRWILWYEEERGGKLTKIPCAPWETGHWNPASATDSENWTDFDTAKKYAQKKEGYGVGFVFSEDDDIVGIDLDDCIVERKVQGFAATVIQEANSYTEISPSGDGAHVFLRGNLSRAIKPEEEDIEAYDCNRFFTVTGRFLRRTSPFLRKKQGLLDKIEEKFEKTTVEYEPKGKGTDVDILNVIPTDQLKESGDELRGPHPVHGSSTDWNLALKPDENKWYCHRAGHECGGGPFEWIAVEEGIVKCGSWSKGKGPLRGKKWSKTIKAAYDRELITADQAEMLTKQAEDEVVPFEDKFDKALDDFISKGNTIRVHPVIDFKEELGLSLGAPLSIEDGKGKTVVTKDSLFAGTSTLEQLDGEPPDKELVARDVDFALTTENIIGKVVQLVVEARREGEIEKGEDSSELFDKVYRKVSYYWYHSDGRWQLALTCWIIGTYFFPLFEWYSIWMAQGQRETGKTTSLKVIHSLAWNPTDIETNLRPAPLYRSVEGVRPTYITDITKLSKQQRNEVVDVYESGVERSGSIKRCIGEANKPKRFYTFCPKAIASRRDLPFDAKAIKVITEEPPTDKEKMKYRRRWTELRRDRETEELRSELMRLALTRWEEVMDAYREVEQDKDLMGRAFTRWESLFAVCKAFAPERLGDLRALAVENARRRKPTDFTYTVENAVLGFLLEEIPEEGVDTYAISLTGDGSLTQGVEGIMDQDVAWQTVKSAVTNLRIIKEDFETSSGKKYRLDVEEVRKRADSRNIGKGEEGVPELDLSEETLEGFDDRSQKDRAGAVMKIIRNLEDEYPEGVPVENVKADAEAEGIRADFVDEFLTRKKKSGELYAPSEGEILTAVG